MIAVGIALAVSSSHKTIERDPEEHASAQNRGMTTSTLHYDNLDYVEIPSSISSVIKEYTGFTVSFNPTCHTPNWVGWELLGTETEGTASRSDKFWQDTDVDGCPTTDDYKNSGFDRGHMCPAADQKWDPKAMTDCFSLANITPQAHTLNAGAWSTLEKRCRNWAKRDSAIVIIAGPIFEKSDSQRIGRSGVRVPGAFFKVIAAPYLKTPRAIGFVYPNMSSPGNMQNYVMTIDQIEELTGYDFFSSLPDDIENKIEATTSFTEWNH